MGYRFSDLGSGTAPSAWVILVLSTYDWITRYDFAASHFGFAQVNSSALIAIGAALYLLYLIVSGRNRRQKTADMLTERWQYGLNPLLSMNVDSEKDFHHWLNRFGAWEADVLGDMAHRHCTMQQRNEVANLHKFDVQSGLFHQDEYKNWWKTMLSVKLERLSKVIDEIAGRPRT